MKIISILLILGAVLMGMQDGGDITGAIVLLLLTAPILFEKSHRRKQSGELFSGGIEQRELRQ